MSTASSARDREREEQRFARAVDRRDQLLDHDVILPLGETVTHWMRVFPNSESCDVVFTVRRRTGMGGAEFTADVTAVEADRATLRAVDGAGGQPSAPLPARHRAVCSVALMEALRAHRRVPRSRPAAAARPPGPAGRILNLQAMAGNRAVAGVLLQRRAAAGLLDAPIALSSPTPQVVDDELVPIGEVPGRFEGFDKRDDALALAKRSPEVAVVVSDGTKFHVLRTTATSLGGTTATPKLPKGWTVVQVVEPVNVPTTSGFRADYDDAAKRSGDDRIAAYRQLLVRASHLELAETGWSPNKDSYELGKVNVALWLTSAGRHLPAKVEPTGTAPLPRTAILIGNTPFTEGAASVRTTLLHEARHAYHRAQSLKLIEQWRGVRKADTADAWTTWLKARKSKVPAEIWYTTSASTNPSAGTASTETYSYLHGFMYRFRRDEAAAKDPKTLGADATRALHFRMIELNGMGDFWEAAGQDVQADALDRLVAFANGLSVHHR